MMQKLSLQATAREQLAAARNSSSHRAATTVVGGHEHTLRQTVIALCAGASLDDHDNLGEATVHVLTGRVELTAAGDVWQGREGDLLIVPRLRHALHAVEDSVVLLSAFPRNHVH